MFPSILEKRSYKNLFYLAFGYFRLEVSYQSIPYSQWKALQAEILDS